MAFLSSGLRAIGNMGISDAQSLWWYSSSQASTDVCVGGFFTGMGAGGRGNSFGMKVLDVVIVAESTSGGTPGRTTIHTVKASTADQASTSASTGYNAAYNCSLSST